MMPRPALRDGSKLAYFRQKVPADLAASLKGRKLAFRLPSGGLGQADLAVSAQVGAAVKFSLQTADPTLARVRHSAAAAQAQAHFEAARRGPRTLSHKEVYALAGEWYREFVAEREEEPGKAADWSLFLELGDEPFDLLHPEDGPAHPGTPSVDEAERLLSRQLDVPAFLAARHLSLAPSARLELLQAISKRVLEGAVVLRRRAQGDYGPDENLTRFPAWTGDKPAVPSAGRVRSFDDLFARWQQETQPSASTVSTWRGYVNRFTAFLEHSDPTRVTNADVVRWKDALVADGRKRVSTTYLAAIGRLYRYAVENAAVTGITSNPAAGVKARQKAVAGERRLPYSPAEVSTILAAASKETDPARRWLPWLQASTGARIGELAQLWAAMVTEVDGVPCLTIRPAPDGGSLKNEGSERTVPLHPAVLEQGFLAFVKQRGDGPLFYRGTGRQAARARQDGARKHASKGVANRLAGWVRELGFTDPRKAPTHAFRHYLKTALMRESVDSALADIIMGHALGSGAGAYRHADVRTMREALAKVELKAG